MLALLLSSFSLAGTITELPDFLRGDIQVGYTFDTTSGSITERELLDDQIEDYDVGARTLQTHRVQYGATFTFAPGAALEISLPQHISDRLSYTESSRMLYNPISETGTYLYSEPEADDRVESGKGLEGVWIGVSGAPFSEIYKERNNKATWKVGVDYRIPASEGFYTYTDTVTRGAGTGLPALRLRGAFSKRFGDSEPYLATAWTWERPGTVEIKDAEQASHGEVELDPGDTLDLRAGVEVIAVEIPESGARFAFDFHTMGAYRTAGLVPSGLYLPEVLGATEHKAVQQGESVELGFGMGLNWRLFTYLGLNVGGEVSYAMPYQLESPYPAYLGPNHVHYAVNGGMTIRLR